jgi:NAD(P)H-nitrite reductase large subunit
MGSSPFIPPLQGIESKGVFTFHTLADTNHMRTYIHQKKVQKVVIIGAGLSGLEAADALTQFNLSITLIEKNNRVLPFVLHQEASNFLHHKITQKKVTLMLGQQVEQVDTCAGVATGVTLMGGMRMGADMVIFATGLRPNTRLAQNAGIAIGSQGVLVNEYMATSIPNIYAAGDLIQIQDRLSGVTMRSCMWPDAMQQGLCAAHAMAGQPKAYYGPSIIMSSAFFDLKFAQAGLFGEPSAESSLYTQEGESFFHQFYLEKGILKAFQVLGTRHNLGFLRRSILTQQAVTIEQINGELSCANNPI